MVRSLAGKHPLYYEAILQLRDTSPAAADFVNDDVRRYAIPVAKIKKVTNGYDYYLADSKYAKALGKRLQQQFGGELRITASLFGQKDGKEIYRVTVLFRGLHYRKGERVGYQGETYVVKALGKDILLQHTSTGRKAHVKFKALKSVKKVE